MKMMHSCCRCHKLFDYDFYYGICPKCCAYNQPKGHKQDDFNIEKDLMDRYFRSEDDSHERMHRMYDTAKVHNPEEQHKQYHRAYDVNKAPHPQTVMKPAANPNPIPNPVGLPNSQTVVKNVTPKKGKGVAFWVVLVYVIIMILSIASIN